MSGAAKDSAGNDIAIDVQGLTKSYGSNHVVKGVDLTVATGEIVAFLGPNGAGKTTTVEIMEGFREADSGTVQVLGEDPKTAPLAWREQIGIVLQESEPIPELTAAESLRMQAGYYRSPRDADEVLAVVGLTESAGTRTRKLSGGQRRRLDLGMALVGDPDLIFLDEPTTGFDPSARRESWGMIEALRDLGKTVLLTTHYMDEAEQLADRIELIVGGVIVASGSADDLARDVDAKTSISWRPDPADPDPPSELGSLISRNGNVARIDAGDDALVVLNRLTGWAIDAGVELADLELRRPTLEDVYLSIIERHGGAESLGTTAATKGAE